MLLLSSQTQPNLYTPAPLPVSSAPEHASAEHLNTPEQALHLLVLLIRRSFTPLHCHLSMPLLFVPLFQGTLKKVTRIFSRKSQGDVMVAPGTSAI